MSSPEVTFILTSCGRLDLLQKTIQTFEKFNTYPIKRAIITEDSCDEEVYKQVRDMFGDRYEILANEEKKGQIRSIVDAYETIDTPYIFHCEDDWEFLRPGFIEESLNVLEHEPKILQVWLESLEEANIATKSVDLFSPKEHLEVNGTKFFTMNIAEGWEWGYFSFKPSLRRKSDYDLINGYSRFLNELDIGSEYKKLDFYCVTIEEPCILNTGHHRHVADPTRIWPNRRKEGKPVGLKRFWGHIQRLFSEGKW